MTTTQQTRGGAGSTSRRTLILAVATLATAGPLSALAKLESWREESASAFLKGKRERVVVSDAGKIRLGQRSLPSANSMPRGCGISP